MKQVFAIIQLSLLLHTIRFRQWNPLLVSNAFQQGTSKSNTRANFYGEHLCKFYHKTFRRTTNHEFYQHYSHQPFFTRKDNQNSLHNRFGLSVTQLNLSSESERKIADPDVDITTPDQELDIPMPTEAGGFTHTKASKAKISAANKGKTPWNKGKTRSEAVKARIAEGVRKRNRERFLKKLEDLGFTEEEYEAQKKEERRKKDAEKRARLTANGGYKLTEETKQKISKILKEKHAKGEVKKRVYHGPFRKGFSHSEETKQKIRESLKKKWAEVRNYYRFILYSDKYL